MRNDDNKINEIIEEAGWRSRQRARLSGMSRATKQAVGDVATAISGTPPASDAGWRGKYALGKQDRILNTLSKDIIRDLTKLGLLPKNGSPVQPDQLKKMLNGFLSNYTGVGRNQTSSSQTNTQQNTTPSVPSTPASVPSTPASVPSSQASTPSVPPSIPSTPASAPSSPLKPVSTSSTTTTTSTPSVPASVSSTPASTTSTSSGKTKLPPATGRSSIPLSQRPSTPSTPAASTTLPTDQRIPNGATIKFKNGTVCQYDSSDDKWHIQSKDGGYLNQTPIDSDELQTKISNAWRKERDKAKTTSTTPAESTPATPSAPEASTPSATSTPDSSSISAPADSDELDADIPDGATIKDKNNTTYEYDSEDKKWWIPSGKGGSLNAIPNDRPQLQDFISSAWQKQNKKQKKKAKEESEKLPAFESFKNFFLNKN
jgi:hypothetical protein